MKQIKDVCNKIKENKVKAIKSCSVENILGVSLSHGQVEEEKVSLKVYRALREEKMTKKKQSQHCFFKDPFKAAKEVITPKVKSKPKVSKSVLN